MEVECLTKILIPGPKSLNPIPIPRVFIMFDSDSSQKWNHYGIGMVHHCFRALI